MLKSLGNCGSGIGWSVTESEKQEAPKENWVQSLGKAITQFWPVSLVLMALTLVSEIDIVVEYSKYLTYFVSIWRDILHGLIGAPIEWFLGLIGFPNIKIEKPIPEIIFIIGNLIFCYLRYEKIDEFFDWHGNSIFVKIMCLPIYLALVLCNNLERYTWVNNLARSGVFSIFLAPFVGWYFYNLFGLLPAVLGLLVVFAIMWLLTSSLNEKIPDTAVAFIALIPITVVLSFCIILFVLALEAIIPYIVEFKQNALGNAS